MLLVSFPNKKPGQGIERLLMQLLDDAGMTNDNVAAVLQAYSDIHWLCLQHLVGLSVVADLFHDGYGLNGFTK